MARRCGRVTLKIHGLLEKEIDWADTGRGRGWGLRGAPTRRNALKVVLQTLEKLETKFLFRRRTMPGLGVDVRKQSSLLFSFPSFSEVGQSVISTQASVISIAASKNTTGPPSDFLSVTLGVKLIEGDVSFFPSPQEAGPLSDSAVEVN